MKPLIKFKGRMLIAVAITVMGGLQSCSGGDSDKVPANLKRSILPVFRKELEAKFSAKEALSQSKCTFATSSGVELNANQFDSYYYFSVAKGDVLAEVNANLNNFLAKPSTYALEMKSLADEVGVVLDFTSGESETGKVTHIEEIGYLEAFGNKKIHLVYVANEANLDKLNSLREKVHKISNFKITGLK